MCRSSLPSSPVRYQISIDPTHTSIVTLYSWEEGAYHLYTEYSTRIDNQKHLSWFSRRSYLCHHVRFSLLLSCSTLQITKSPRRYHAIITDRASPVLRDPPDSRGESSAADTRVRILCPIDTRNPGGTQHRAVMQCKLCSGAEQQDRRYRQQ